MLVGYRSIVAMKRRIVVDMVDVKVGLTSAVGGQSLESAHVGIVEELGTVLALQPVCSWLVSEDKI